MGWKPVHFMLAGMMVVFGNLRANKILMSDKVYKVPN